MTNFDNLKKGDLVLVKTRYEQWWKDSSSVCEADHVGWFIESKLGEEKQITIAGSYYREDDHYSGFTIFSLEDLLSIEKIT